MKKFRADLHIHTVLSPCADLGMSPDQIIKQAKKNKLDIIAITDHNSTLQCDVVRKMAEDKGLVVLNGCEVNSKEEVHALCLFEDDYTRKEFQKFLDDRLQKIPNKPEYSGYQVLVNQHNYIMEELPFYLGNSILADLEEIEKFTHQINGLFIPAHIDRPINSIFSQLGFIPKELQIDGLQISFHANESKVRKLYDIPHEVSVISSSDAHYPDDIGRGCTVFQLNEPTFQEIKWAFQKKNGRSLKIEG